MKQTDTLQDISALWIPIVFLGMVFYMDDAYFNLLEAKAYVFQMASMVYIVAVFVCLLLRERNRQGSLMDAGGRIKNKIKNLTILDISVLGLVVVAAISTLLSMHPGEAFLGSYGWSVGGLYLLTLGVLYFLVSRCMRWENWMYTLILISGILVFSWTCCDIFYLDIFRLHEGIVEKIAYDYVASIGNVNWFAGYLALMLPFYFFGLQQEKKWKQVLSAIGLFLGAFAAVNCNADSVFLGLGVLAFFSLIRCIGDRKESFYTGIGWLIVGIAAGISDGLRNLVSMVEIEELSGLFVEGHLWLAVVVAGVLLMVSPQIKNRRSARIAVVVIAVALIVFTGVMQLRIMDASWGTNRGGIWQTALDAFVQSSLLEKIVGIGPDCFGFAYAQLTGSDWVRNAHNEYLQYLVTTGVSGLIFYMGIYIGAAIMAYRAMNTTELKKQKLAFICIVSIFSYGAQAVVNNPQALNGAIFITILAILSSCDIIRHND